MSSSSVRPVAGVVTSTWCREIQPCSNPIAQPARYSR
ncbi:Uncharacterised protein [Bordetella pertussis]|nr:Uncharacterised protein [Bordetella pertussis]CFW42695.1 Uncharacterised protein [Bordetella pertussis]